MQIQTLHLITKLELFPHKPRQILMRACNWIIFLNCSLTTRAREIRPNLPAKTERIVPTVLLPACPSTIVP